MEGIVRELVNRKVIQFPVDPGKFMLLGYEIEARPYNNSFVCSVVKIKDALSIGDIVTVANGIGSIQKNVANTGGNPNAFNPFNPFNPFNKDTQEMINLLIEIRDLLKAKPVKEKKKTEEEEGVLTICGIKCRQDPNWDGKSRHRYVPTAKLDKDCSDAEFYAWSADHAKINGIELP